jgi:hypothetical protein
MSLSIGLVCRVRWATLGLNYCRAMPKIAPALWYKGNGKMNKFNATLCVVGLSTIGFGAFAQPSKGETPLAPIYACADKSDPNERLACFDATVAAIRTKEAKSEIVTFDKQRVEKVRREAFGFYLPSLPRLGFPALSTPEATKGPSKESSSTNADIEEQVFVVTAYRQVGGNIILTLENGQIWQLSEADTFNAPSGTPFNVKIRTAALGSFILTIEGRNKGYRVRRLS